MSAAWGALTSAFAACRARGTRGVLLGALLCCVLLALGAAPAGALIDLSGPAFQILAPGEDGGLPPTQFSTDQGMLYDALTPHRGNVTAKIIEEDYLSEKFGVQGPVLRTESTGRARPRNPARQPRHPTRLRRNARRCDVRLRLDRR